MTAHDVLAKVLGSSNRRAFDKPITYFWPGPPMVALLTENACFTRVSLGCGSTSLLTVTAAVDSVQIATISAHVYSESWGSGAAYRYTVVTVVMVSPRSRRTPPDPSGSQWHWRRTNFFFFCFLLFALPRTTFFNQ